MVVPAESAPSWSARYRDAHSIRSLGAIEYLACTSAKGDEPRVSAAARSADREALAVLAEVARLHRILDHPRIPRVVEAGAGFVVFACDAVVDLETVAKLAAETSYPVDVSGAAAFVIAMLELL